MKRLISILLAVVMAFCLVLPAAAASAYFEDVPSSSWFYKSVREAYEQGLMLGVSDSEFKPGDTLTRGMFVTVLGRVAKINADSYRGKSHFSDVAKGKWYEPYVAWAQEKEITSGVGGNKFAPDNPVTREQMATFIARYVKASGHTLPNAATPVSGFKDIDQVSSWAKEGLELMRVTGLIIGDSKGNFNPKKTATRAEAATVFIRLYHALYGTGTAPVNTWLDTPPTPPTPPPPEDPYNLPVVANPIVSNEELLSVLNAHKDWFTQDGFRFNSLVSINTKYASQIGAYDRTRPLLFLFEGAGACPSNTNYLYGAMGVLVQDGKITWINLFCSTLPDTLNASWNGGTPMPTLKSGIYSADSWYHNTTNTPNCPGLHLFNNYRYDVPVVRNAASANPYPSTSNAIDVHRRSHPERNSSTNPYISSAGCLLVGRTGTGATDDYATYASKLGLINPGDSGTHYVRIPEGTYVCKVIVDRDCAGSYLSSLGYSAQAISMIG